MKIYHLFLAALLWGCSNTPNGPNDVNRYSHKGKVKRLIVLSYQGDAAPTDTSDFYSRVLYDFNEEGNIIKMQSIVSMKRYNMPPQVYNYEYLFKDGKKTGWLEESANSEDKGFGSVEWLEEKKLEEKGFGGDSTLLFRTITHLTDDYEEGKVDFRYFNDTALSFHMIYENIYEDGERQAIIENNQLNGEVDTAYFDVKEKDGKGNPLRVNMRYGSEKPGRFIIRQFEYY